MPRMKKTRICINPPNRNHLKLIFDAEFVKIILPGLFGHSISAHNSPAHKMNIVHTCGREKNNFLFENC